MVGFTKYLRHCLTEPALRDLPLDCPKTTPLRREWVRSTPAKAYAFVQRRGYVTPQDVKSIGMDVLRHRVIPSYEAEAEDKNSEDIVRRIFEEVEVP